MANALAKLLNMFLGRDQQGEEPRRVKPASQDPYGDPADNPSTSSRVKPASEDPYGDPADRKK